MQTVRVRQVDAFTDEPTTGNPAAVVLRADDLTGGQREAIARELAPSVTAFCAQHPSADYHLRCVTSTGEDCRRGHATIATFSLLLESGAIGPGTYEVETETRSLSVEATEDGTIWLTLGVPRVETVAASYERVADALGIDVGALLDVADDLPLGFATIGSPCLVVPVAFLESLGAMDPDVAAIGQLCSALDVERVYAFTFDALAADSTLHGRTFTPSAAGPEEPLTASASAAVGGYLQTFDAFETFPEELRLEQGHYVDRPGAARVRIDGDVRVGGRAVTVLDGTLVVPSVAGDDIIEA